MRQPVTPRNETARLEALYELEILDEDHHHLFEGLAELAAQLFGARTGLISLVDADRQWFAARHNMDAEETPRSISFCGHAIIGRSVMVVSDARLDSRFRDNPLVTMPENPIRFYAGAPLVTPDDLALGTLCVLDSTPKYPTDRQTKALEQLAKLAVDQMELRRHMLRQERQARAAYQEHRARARQLYDLGQDLKVALDGIVDMSNRLEEKVKGEKVNGVGLDHTISALKHSAMSLFHVTEMLTAEGLGVLEQSQPRATRVNPLAITAAAIAIFAAETERRGMAIQLHSQDDANCDIETDQEMLRLALFHALGFALNRSNKGDIHVTIAALNDERRLRIDIRFPVDNRTGSDPLGIEELNAVLEGQTTDMDCQAKSLVSLRLLLSRLRGTGSVLGSDEHLIITLVLPMSLTASNQETYPSTRPLPAA